MEAQALAGGDEYAMTRRGQAMRKNNQYLPAQKQLVWCAVVVFIGFLSATGFALWMHHLGFGYPYNTFLYKPTDHFGDFKAIWLFTKGLNPYQYPDAFSFPLTYWVVFPLTLSSMRVGFVIFNLIFFPYLFWLIRYYTQHLRNGMSPARYYSIILAYFLTYPVLYCVDRGNIEMFLFMFLTIFLIAFQYRRHTIAAVMLAITIGMKGFPAVFLLLFVKERQYKALIICVGLTLLLSLAAAFSLHGNFADNWYLYQHVVVANLRNHFLLSDWIFQTASIFSVIKLCLWYALGATPGNMLSYQHAIEALLPFYTLSTFIIFAALGVYIIKFENTFWKNVTLLICAMIVLPTVSFDYKLIYILQAFLLFLNRAEQKGKYDFLYASLFALLFIPKAYYVFQPSYAPIGNIINMVLMLLLAGLIIYEHAKHSRNRG